MDISDAFQADAIQAADAVLSEEEADNLRTWVGALYEERLAEFDLQPGAEDGLAISNSLWLELVTHAFMAGRTYAGQSSLRVEMRPEVASAFIEFLAERAL